MNRSHINQSHVKELEVIVPDGIEENVDLSEISRWKIGGVADCVVRPSDTKEVSSLIQYISKKDLPYVVIGSTSNLLFSDNGLRAICIQIGNRMSDYRIYNKCVWAQAGVWVPGFTRRVAMSGLSGIEHAAGIPGTLGGLICMNGGSQRKGIGSQVARVLAVSPNGEVKNFLQSGCDFKYRTSVFQKNRFLITEVELSFRQERSYESIRDEMLEILNSRRNKFPQKNPNCGSTFISNPEIYQNFGPPGKVIEELGLKGYRIGDAEVSSLHANFINNRGKATSSNVLDLIHYLRDKVYDYTGFSMDSEVKFVSENGEIKPAHLVNL